MKTKLKILWQTCLTSLKHYYISDDFLLARNVAWTDQGWLQSEGSFRNTANVLIALNKIKADENNIAFDPDKLLHRLIQDQGWRDLPSCDIALLIWADALGSCDCLDILWDVLYPQLQDVDKLQTMDKAWILSALCHILLQSPSQWDVAGCAEKTLNSLLKSQNPQTGLFYKSLRREGFLRRKPGISSLSNQTYPIQALSLYAALTGDQNSLDRAAQCANMICRLQGPLGQWWWIYDVSQGQVSQKYPVYSVNQDAAVPLAFWELGWAQKEFHFENALNLGLQWLFGENEVDMSLVQQADGVIWRGLEKVDDNMQIIPEMYSYHPARCLYALCLKRSML